MTIHAKHPAGTCKVIDANPTDVVGEPAAGVCL